MNTNALWCKDFIRQARFAKTSKDKVYYLTVAAWYRRRYARVAMFEHNNRFSVKCN